MCDQANSIDLTSSNLDWPNRELNIVECYNEVMQSEWHKYSPRDLQTHPRENTRVEMKDAGGAQFFGGYLAGHFVRGGVVSASAADLPKCWRYAA